MTVGQLSEIFLSCSSGLGAEMILSLSRVKWRNNRTSASVKEAMEYGTARSWLVTFLWYFPYLAFLFGLYKAIIFQKQNGAEGFGNTVIFLTLVSTGAGFWVIFKVRKGIWSYVKERLRTITKSDQVTDELMEKFKGFQIINLKEFQPLITVSCLFLTFSALLFIIFAFLPSNFYYFIGAAALMVFGLAAWVNVYITVELLDKLHQINPFTFNGKAYTLSLKFVISLWVLFCSYFNQDANVFYAL